MRALEIALRALEEAVIEAAVDPLEVEEGDERATHARVLEYRAARVEGERVHAGGQPRLEFLLENAPVRYRRHVVAFGPAAGIVLRAQVDVTAAEGLEQRRALAVVLEPHLAEVEAAAVHAEVAPQ